MAMQRWQLIPQGNIFILQKFVDGQWQTKAGGWKTEAEGRQAADGIIKADRQRRIDFMMAQGGYRA